MRFLICIYSVTIDLLGDIRERADFNVASKRASW